MKLKENMMPDNPYIFTMLSLLIIIIPTVIVLFIFAKIMSKKK